MCEVVQFFYAWGFILTFVGVYSCAWGVGWTIGATYARDWPDIRNGLKIMGWSVLGAALWPCFCLLTVGL